MGLGSQTCPKHPWMLSLTRPPSCQQKRATEKPVKQVGEQAPDVIYYFYFLWVVGHLKTKLLLEEALYERFKAVQTV